MRRVRDALFAAATLSVVALASGSAAATVVATHDALACEIEVERSGAMVAIAPTVTAHEATDGAYRLTLAGSGPSGRSSIRQGGAFTAQAGETVRLSRALVSASATTDATLEITAGGETVACARRIAP